MYVKIALQNTRIFQYTAKCASVARPTLSVERRFKPTKDSIVRLAKNSGDMPFLKHVHLGRRVIKESYILDDVVKDKHPPHRRLLRMRNGSLEAKIETFGIGKGAAFATIPGEGVEMDLFRSGQSDTLKIQKLDDLDPLNWMRTIREEWEVNGFKVAVDHTLFGSWLWGKAIYPQKPFCIGKVESIRDWRTTKQKKLKAQEMDRKLDEFLKQHQRTFPSSEGEVQDKLEAFEIWLHDHIDKMCSGFKTTDEWQKRGMYDY